MEAASDMPHMNSLNLKTHDASNHSEEEEYEDPLTQVAESQCGDVEEWPPQQIASQRPGTARDQGTVLDKSINLQLTSLGIRQVVGRKATPRPKPLLKLICKGCGLSTHDADEFIKDDWVECHGHSFSAVRSHFDLYGCSSSSGGFMICFSFRGHCIYGLSKHASSMPWHGVKLEQANTKCQTHSQTLQSDSVRPCLCPGGGPQGTTS